MLPPSATAEAQAKARHTLQSGYNKQDWPHPVSVGTEELHALSHLQAGTQDDTTTLGNGLALS